MILFLADGKQIRGDLIKSAALRYDLAPIPVTLEAEIRAGDDDMEKRLAEGQLVSVGTGDSLRIVKSVKAAGRAAQGERQMTAIRITAMLVSCQRAEFVRCFAMIKVLVSFSEIFRGAGSLLMLFV